MRVYQPEDQARAVGDIATTIFHPVSTAKMATDAMAVVDPELRRAWPRRPPCRRLLDHADDRLGNTHAPAVTIAEKAAQFIAAAA